MKRIKKLNKMPKLDLKNVSKFWEREYSLFTMSAWKNALDIINSKQWSEKMFSIFICIYCRGIAQHFRSQGEENKFEIFIGKKIIRGKLFRRKIFKWHTFYAEHLINLYKQIEKAENFNLQFVRDFNLSFGKLTAFNTFIQRGIDYIAKFEKYLKVADSLIKQRTKYEHVMGDYERYLEKMCYKIAKRKKIKNTKLLKLLTIDEFIKFLKTNKLPTDLKQRNRISALILLPKPFLLTGRPAMSLLKRLKIQERTTTQQLSETCVLRGSPVYTGKIKGYIQVIPSLKQLRKFKMGHILVAKSTQPEYNTIIKRAKGIITDEGGLLSHAAVLSREFKIPGIVGTKIATKKLKTGQLVELDAVSGVVKVLKK